MTHNEKVKALRDTISALDEALFNAAVRLADLYEANDLTDDIEWRDRRIPRLDAGNYCVCWHRRRCHLGPTTSYRLFARLVQRADRYVPYEHLLRDVWGERMISDHTVRSAVRHLKAKLIEARMTPLARAIHGDGKHYGLILHSEKR